MRRYRKIVIGLACALIVGLLMSAVPLSAISEFFVVPEFVTEAEESPEIVEARTRTSKTYDLGDNKYSLDIGIGSAHYRDEFGDWREIDNQWTAATAPWDWEMLEDGYHTSVLEDFTAGQILLFESQGESVAFQPMALQWTNDIDQIAPISMPQGVVANVSNDPVELLPGMSGYVSKIKWDDGYGTGRHFEWQNSPGRLGKLLTLDSSPPIPPQFIIDGGSPVLRLNFIFDPSNDLDIYVDDVLWDKRSNEQTFNTIEFRLGEGEDSVVLWGFMPTGYWDSNEAYGVGLTELRKVGNSLYVSVRVPYEWLQMATYPIYIDPPLDLQVGANLDDVYEKESDGVVTDSDAILHHSDGAASGRYWGAYRWVSGSLPALGDTIDVAYAEVYVYHGVQTFRRANTNLHFEKAASPAQFSTDAYDVTGRTRTSSSASWIDDALSADWHETPSLVTPLQELIDSYSPTAIALICRPNQDATKNLLTRAYNYDSALAAKLHIEWTAGAAAEGYSYGTIIG